MSALMHRWFVQYNPLYFASALLVLLGVVFLTRDPLDWAHGQLALAGLIQLYELALIGGAALLFNLPGQRRPAVILGIVALAFAFDLTFRTEALASVGTRVLGASVLWGALLAIKLALVARALRVRLPRMHAAGWTLAGLMLAIAPHLIADEVVDRRIVLTAACWLGIGLVALVFRLQPRLTLRAALDDWGKIVAGRLTALIPPGWAVLYWLHIAAWCGIYELRVTPLCFAPAVLFVPFAVRSEAATWVAAAIVLAVGAHLPPVAVLLALGLALKAHRQGMPRLHVAALVAAYLAGPKWLAPDAWVSIVASAALAMLAWRYRLPTALGAALAVAVPLVLPWLPGKAGQWGAVLMAGGFVALGAGVALNWWSGKIARDADLRIRLPLLRP